MLNVFPHTYLPLTYFLLSSIQSGLLPILIYFLIFFIDL